MRKVRLSRITRKAVVERARLKGHCECDRTTHDHGFDDCHRKPRYFAYKQDFAHTPQTPHPDCIIAICSSCRSQIDYEEG